MTQQIEPPVTSKENISRILELVNSALGPDDLVPLVDSEDIAMSLMTARRSIGGFVSLAQLEEHGGLSAALIDRMIAFVATSKIEFDTERLNYVVWAHGCTLLADDRSIFKTERRASGLRIRTKTQAEQTQSGINVLQPGSDWLHISIPTPAFANGDRFYLRDVILNYASSNPGYGLQGRPVASLEEIEVRDGHVRLLKADLEPAFETNSHRYRRVPVDVGRKTTWGIGVSLRPYIVQVPLGASEDFHITVSAVGAEFVTRSGLVVQQ